MKTEFDEKEKGKKITDLSKVAYPKGLVKTGNVRRSTSITWWEVEDLATGKILEMAE